MRKASLVAIAILAMAVPAMAPQAWEMAEAAHEKLLPYFPNLCNSPEELALAEHIVGQARAWGYQARVKASDIQDRWHSFSRTVLCELPGSDRGTIVLAAPLNSPPGLADPWAASMPAAVLLACMERIARQGRPPGKAGIVFAFIGDEYQNEEAYGGLPIHSGSEALAAEIAETYGAALLYVDLRGTSRDIELVNHSDRIVSPLWIFQGLVKSFYGKDFSIRHQGAFNQFYRSGLVTSPGIQGGGRTDGRMGGAGPFLDAGIPALEISSRGEGRASAAWMADVQAAIQEFLGLDSGGMAETWDRHYLVIDLPMGPVALKEKDFVVFVIISISLVLGLFMTASLIMRRQVKAILAGFARNLLSLFAAFGLCWACILLVARAGSAILEAKAAPGAWSGDFAFQASLRALGLFALLVCISTLAIQLRLMPHRLAFYSAASALLFFVDAFIAATLDISFSVYFAWSALICLAAIVVRRRTATLVFYVLGLLPLAWLGYAIAMVKSERLHGIMMNPNPGQAAIMSCLVLPVFLYSLRCFFVLRRSREKPAFRKSLWLIVPSAFAAAGASAALAARAPYAPDRPLPVDIVEYLEPDGHCYIGVRAEASRGAWVSLDGAKIGLDAGGASLRRADLRKPPISMVLRGSAFLSRKILRAELRMEGRPYLLLLRLRSTEPMDIFECNLPFELEEGGLSASLPMGPDPDSPLSIELTVPESFEAELEVQAIYPGLGAEASAGARIASHLRKALASFRLR